MGGGRLLSVLLPMGGFLPGHAVALSSRLGTSTAGDLTCGPRELRFQGGVARLKSWLLRQWCSWGLLGAAGGWPASIETLPCMCCATILLYCDQGHNMRQL